MDYKIIILCGLMLTGCIPDIGPGPNGTDVNGPVDTPIDNSKEFENFPEYVQDSYATGIMRTMEAGISGAPTPMMKISDMDYISPPLRPVNGKPYDAVFFENYGVNPFVSTEDETTSTFGMDVDTASYTIARRYLRDGNMPDKDSIRTEEFINYFQQDYPSVREEFGIFVEGAESIFGKPNYHLVKIGIKAKDVLERKPANMIFVVDVSGSMNREDRLGTVKKTLRMLAKNLHPGDKVGLVIYGSHGKKVLDLTHDMDKINRGIDQLVAQGSTNAAEGLEIAYEMMNEGFEEGKINRIILCSDGVANFGYSTDADEILGFVKDSAEKGITLTTLGFGMGNYNDVLMEKLANHGDGNYYYIDTMREARRLLEDPTAMLEVVGSDAKIQVEFNEDVVDRYRLIGYENRHLENEDFLDDTVDAGEVGAGQTVTALYEVRIKDNARGKLADVRIRYETMGKVEQVNKEVFVEDVDGSFSSASDQFKFTAAVAEFAELLKESYWARDGSFEAVLEVAKETGIDSEFIELVKDAKAIKTE